MTYEGKLVRNDAIGRKPRAEAESRKHLVAAERIREDTVHVITNETIECTLETCATCRSPE